MSAAGPVGGTVPGRGSALLGSLREAVALLLPARCLGCDGHLPLDGSREPVCATCASRLREPGWPRCPRCHIPWGTGRVTSTCLACRTWPSALVAARSAVVLEAPADRLVHALKYGGWRELALPMAARMASIALAPDVGRDARVVPVPTTPKRERERGYNQAALLATALAERVGLPYVEALRRRPGAVSQVSLHPDERRANVRNAFGLAEDGRLVRGGRVLLVDDVLTTGATACEAAETLERGGATGVTLITFARALPERRRS